MDPQGGNAVKVQNWTHWVKTWAHLMKKRSHRSNLELDPLGGTTLGCRSCLCLGTSQVQPGVDCHQMKINDGDANDEKQC